MKLSTDAPPDWPVLELEMLMGNNHMNAVHIAKELSRNFNENKKDHKI